MRLQLELTVGMKSKDPPRPLNQPKPVQRAGMSSPSPVLRRTRLDGFQQRIVCQVAVALGALVAGVTQLLADGEQIDTAVESEGHCRVMKVVE